jgi:glycosyltransferase involved in cell wall biosynthesis
MTNSVLVFVPCYNCERQIARVVRQFQAVPRDTIHEILIVDNCSQDGTARLAAANLSSTGPIPSRVVRNTHNYGLGGSHKAAFAYAERRGHSHVVVLHGDDQGTLSDVLPVLQSGAHRQFDACLGARFMPGSRLIGYSGFRSFGNRTFNLLFSAAVGRRVFDLGSGLNVFARSVFASSAVLRYPDDLRFNVHVLLGMYDRAQQVSYFPISWREEDQVSNVKIISQALRTACAAAHYVFRREHLRNGEHRITPRDSYTFEIVAEHGGDPRP